VHKSSQWRQSCDELVALLDGYSDTLLLNLQRFIEIGDKSGAETIWSSCITCLAYLTTLCEFIGRTEPTASLAMNALCDSNLEKLGHLTEDMRLEDYTYLDLLLGVSTCKTSWLLLNGGTDESVNGLAILGEILGRLRVTDQQPPDGGHPDVTVLERSSSEGVFDLPRETSQ
jgi:hypothetical protein